MKHWFADVGPFRLDPLRFLLERASGTPAALEPLALGFQSIYLVTDPLVARHVLKTDDAFIDKGRLVQKLKPLLGDSFLTLSGEEHSRRRQVLHHQLARGVANRYAPAMAGAIRRSAASLARERTINPHQVTGPLALNLICIALFGEDVISPGDRALLIGAMKSIEDELADEMFRAWPLTPWAAHARNTRRRFALNDMSFVVKRVRNNVASSGVLRALEDLNLTDIQIRDEILTMLLAGHHTTGTVAAWLLYHLAAEQGLADSVAEEARSISDENGEIRVAKLNDAEVSLGLVREVLRLYPSAWWFSREVKKPIEIAGKKLKRGTSLIVCPWQMHRDPRFWSDPHSFRSDRQYTGTGYLPFGAGPRACVGMGVALLELQLLALEMAAAYRFGAVTPSPAPWPKASVTLIPPELSIEIAPRESTRWARSAA